MNSGFCGAGASCCSQGCMRASLALMRSSGSSARARLRHAISTPPHHRASRPKPKFGPRAEVVAARSSWRRGRRGQGGGRGTREGVFTYEQLVQQVQPECGQEGLAGVRAPCAPQEQQVSPGRSDPVATTKNGEGKRRTVLRALLANGELLGQAVSLVALEAEVLGQPLVAVPAPRASALLLPCVRCRWG